MIKKILIGLGVLLVVAALYVTQVLNKRSPHASAAAPEVGVSVEYSRPFKKDRLIFGEGEAALVPFGKYWRLGANAATEITFAKAATLAGKPVAAGTYRIYAIPGATTWKVVLNSETGWGAREPDHTKDVLTVEVPAEKAAQSLEQFTISFDGPVMVFSWDTTVVRVPLG